MNDPVKYENWVNDNAARYAMVGLIGWVLEAVGNIAIIAIMYGIVGPILLILSAVAWLLVKLDIVSDTGNDKPV